MITYLANQKKVFNTFSRCSINTFFDNDLFCRFTTLLLFIDRRYAPYILAPEELKFYTDISTIDGILLITDARYKIKDNNNTINMDFN